jgi:hypothetical protein
LFSKPMLTSGARAGHVELAFSVGVDEKKQSHGD